ncbi:MAG: Mov34/MPN/PAD-1 family protein [bacterium]
MDTRNLKDEDILNEIKLTEIKESVKPIPEKMPIHNSNCAIRLWVDKPEYSLKIFIAKEIMEEILNYSQKDTTRELGGVLVGDYCHENKIKFIKISNFIEARNTQADNSHIRFNHDTWNAIERERKSRKIPEEKQMVGWFHTHPGWGIFLSEDDLFIHQNFFNLPWQVAMVVDPLQKDQGFFVWENDKIIKCREFYLYTTKARESELTSFIYSLHQCRKLER